jgi:hypothetical protein
VNLRAVHSTGTHPFLFYDCGSTSSSFTAASRHAVQEAQEPQQDFLLESPDFEHRAADAHPIHEIPFFLGRRIYQTASTTIKRSSPLIIQSAPFIYKYLPFRKTVFLNTVYETVTKA